MRSKCVSEIGGARHSVRVVFHSLTRSLHRGVSLVHLNCVFAAERINLTALHRDLLPRTQQTTVQAQR